MKQAISTNRFMSLAEEKFIEMYEDGYRLNCSICGKTFKGNSARTNIIKHLHEEHQSELDHLSSKLKLDELEAVWIPSAKDWLQKTLEAPKVLFEESVKIFLEKFSKDPSYCIQWKSENLVKEQATWKWWEDNITGWFIPERFTGFPEALKNVKEAKDSLIRCLTTNSPQFSSTSPITNVMEIWERKALSDLVNGWSSARLSSLIRHLEDIISMIDEVNSLHKMLDK
jgi:hypothetical protein